MGGIGGVSAIYTGQWNGQVKKRDGRGYEVRLNTQIIEGHWSNGVLVKGRRINSLG